jgi:hypothetical protein
MEKTCNETEVARIPVDLCPVKDLTRREEISPEAEEDKIAFSVF